MNKILAFLFIFIFVLNCSLDKKSGLWTKSKKISKEIEKNIKTKDLFLEEKALNKEHNVNLKIRLTSKPKNKSFINNLDNNNGRVNYNGNLKSISRYKFSKIKNFNNFEPEIIFSSNSIIFFDNKGAILKFDSSSKKLLWKKNYYSKKEKKLQPILFFANDQNILIVTDNIAKYYALNIHSGDLIWTKNNKAPFNSQIKIYKDKFFVVDFENTLRCFSLKSGDELWKVRTEQAFIKSSKKQSLIILDGKVIFTNSVGAITAVDIEYGSLIWQTHTQSTSIYAESFFLKTSDIIAEANSILFSNNKNQFFSLDSKTGFINWKQKINSHLRVTIVDGLIFSISQEGLLIIIDNKNGNIIRVTDVFKKFKKKKRNKIVPEGFIVGTQNIYLTTNNGRLIIIDILTGKTISILKIDNEKISRPYALNENLFIVKDNSIIKLN